MTPDLPTSRWLRRARWAVALVAIGCCAVAVIWVYRAAMKGDVLAALAGAVFCLGIIALDVAAAALFRLGGLTMRCIRRMEQLDARLSALEFTLERKDRTVGLIANENTEAASLVAATLKADIFPRLWAVDDNRANEDRAPDGERPTVREDAPNIADSHDGQDELDRLVHREMHRLRGEFADLVRGGDYAGALRTGERIATLFPDSTLAREFNSIRRHLSSRASAAGQVPADERASAV